jgi:hypothetical protein
MGEAGIPTPDDRVELIKMVPHVRFSVEEILG